MRKNSIKNTRINEEVLRELSHIIHGEIKDPRIAPMTSVTSVEVAPDLKTCKAYVSVLGDEEAQKNTLLGLRSAEGYIRRELARTVNLRNTPEIRFILDQSIAYGVRMSKVIDEVVGEDAARASAAVGGDGASSAAGESDDAARASAAGGSDGAGHVRPNGDCAASAAGESDGAASAAGGGDGVASASAAGGGEI